MENILLISSFALWVLVVLNLLLTLGLARRINTALPKSEQLKVGQRAPNFNVPTLQGKAVQFSEFTGRAFVLVFFSPDCPPCSEIFSGIAQLKACAQQASAELLLVGDHQIDKLRTYTQKLDIDLPILIAPRQYNSLLTDYKVLGVPWHCIVDEHGKVFSADFGSIDDIEQGLYRLQIQRKEVFIQENK